MRKEEAVVTFQTQVLRAALGADGGGVAPKQRHAQQSTRPGFILDPDTATKAAAPASCLQVSLTLQKTKLALNRWSFFVLF